MSQSQTMNFDHLFDLDMAMEYPVNNTEENLERENSCSDLELPSVIANGVCPVCLEDYKADDEEVDCNKQVPCGHIFHGNCIQVWLSRHNSCPLCRSSVYAASASAGRVS